MKCVFYLKSYFNVLLDEVLCWSISQPLAFSLSRECSCALVYVCVLVSVMTHK